LLSYSVRVCTAPVAAWLQQMKAYPIDLRTKMVGSVRRRGIAISGSTR
jgi:hypothetical protein